MALELNWSGLAVALAIAMVAAYGGDKTPRDTGPIVRRRRLTFGAFP